MQNLWKRNIIETREHVVTICITRTDKPMERVKKKEGITIEWIRKVIEKRMWRTVKDEKIGRAHV